MARRDLDEWLWQVGHELQKLSEEILPNQPQVAKGKCWQPRVDLLDAGAVIVVKAEIAGVQGDSIRVSYNRDRHSLTLRGTREDTDWPDSCSAAHLLEIYYGEFEREVRLPAVNLDVANIRAQYRNGFLFVVIPKENEEAGQIVVTETVTIKRF